MNDDTPSTRILLVMRHGKSSWKDPSLADRYRPLTKRGVRDAPRMGRRLADAGLSPTQIHSSTAERAVATAEGLLPTCDHPPPVFVAQDLYHADVHDLLMVIRSVDEPCPRLMLIGHNPSLEMLVERVVGEDCELPTSAIALLWLELGAWVNFEFSTPVRDVRIWRPRDPQTTAIHDDVDG